ncbi:MAG TPA: hypothetical protein VKB12_06910 [Pyrinomonadaceae bacterium]|nr:hypothetical protein [Pyrinomonadaceae bacterium]
MRRYAYALLFTAAALVLCVGAGAQKKAQPDAKAAQSEVAALKQDASLAETLTWLNDNLTRYGKFTLFQPLPETGTRRRTRFLGLEARGCSVRYLVKHEQIGGGGGGGTVRAPVTDVERRSINEVVRAPNGLTIRSPDSRDNVYRPNVWKPTAEGSSSNVEARTVDLAALDPSLVRGETPKKWDGGFVAFSAGRGKAAVSYTDTNGKLQAYDGDGFYVNKKERVEQIADALRHAVELCKK